MTRTTSRRWPRIVAALCVPLLALTSVIACSQPAAPAAPPPKAAEPAKAPAAPAQPTQAPAAKAEPAKAPAAPAQPTQAPAAKAAPAKEAPKQTYKIRLALIPTFITPLFELAQDRGIYKELGLELDIIRFNSGPAQFAAAKSGDIDLVDMSSMTFLVGRSQGIDMKTFNITGDIAGQNYLVAQKDAGIKAAPDLKGKKITAVQGSSSYYGLLTYLTKAGMKIEDVEYLNMDGAAITPAFIKKDVVAAWHWAPWWNKMIEAGGVAVTTNKQIGAPGVEVLAGRAEWLKSNQEAATRMLEAQARVWAILKKEPALLINSMAQAIGVSQQMAKEIYDVVYYPTNEDLLSNDSAYSLVKGNEDGTAGIGALLKENADFELMAGIIKDRPDLKGAIDPGPIKAWQASKR